MGAINKAAFLLLGLFLLPFIRGDPYQDCTIYGNCQPVKTSVTFNNNTGNVNNTYYWNGLTTSNLSSYVPYVGASKNVDLNNFNLTRVQRIGIGTSAPIRILHVNGSTADGRPVRISTTGTASSVIEFENPSGHFAYIGLIGGNNGIVGGDLVGDTVLYSNADLKIGTNGGGVQAIMVKQTTGRIGLGSSTPLYSLDVNRTNSVVRIGSGVDNSGTATVLFGHRSSSTDVQQKTAIISSAVGDWGRANLHLALNTVSDNSNVSLTDSKLMISGSTGNVGIGTVTPSRALDVRGIGNFSGELYVQNGSAVSPWLYNQSFDTTNLTASYVPYVGASGNVDLNGKNFTNSMTITSPGAFAFKEGAIAFGKINNTARGSMNVSGNGSAIFGYVVGENSSMLATNDAVFIQGMTTGINSSISTKGDVLANFIQGWALGTNSRIIASDASGTFTQGVTQGSNSLIETGFSGGFAQGYAQGSNSSIRSLQSGAFAQGIAQSTNSRIIAEGGGAFAQGRTVGTNAHIIASGTGSFAHGDVLNTANLGIVASSNGAVAMGIAPLTASGQASFALGRGINVTGTNSFGYGMGATNAYLISQPRVFSVMTGAVGINSTGPQYALEVNGGAKAFNVSNFLFANGTHVGIGQSNPTYPLEVGVNYSGISAWFQGNISVDDVIFRSKVFDTSKGSALKYVKNASAYKFQNGTINHSAFDYSKVTYTNRRITGYHTVQVDKEVCAPVKKQVEIETYDENGLVNGTTTEEQEVVECPVKKVPEVQPIYENYQEEGYSLEDEVAVLRQSIFEIKSETCAKQPAQWSWCT